MCPDISDSNNPQLSEHFHFQPEYPATIFLPLMNDLDYPVFITENRNDHILIANTAAIAGCHDESVIDRPLQQVVLGEKILEDQTRLAYFNNQWLVITKTPIKWDGSHLNMISLQHHPALPDGKQIRSAKDMVAIVLHRLRSPVTGMQGYLDMLLDSIDLEPHQRRLSRLSDGISQFNTILNELELLHSIGIRSEPETLHLPNVVQDVITGLDLSIQKRIILNKSSRKHWIPSNQRQLKTLLTILIDNALEHTSGKNREIIIDLESNRQITITNFGNPIPEYIKCHLFLPFITNKAQNAGVGLTCAHLLAKQIGASVFLTKNSKAEGISFSIFFPPVNPA